VFYYVSALIFRKCPAYEILRNIVELLPDVRGTFRFLRLARYFVNSVRMRQFFSATRAKIATARSREREREGEEYVAILVQHVQLRMRDSAPDKKAERNVKNNVRGLRMR